MAVICAYSSILPYRGRSAPSLMVSVRLGTVGAALGSRGRSANSRAGVLVRAAYSPSLRGGGPDDDNLLHAAHLYCFVIWISQFNTIKIMIQNEVITSLSGWLQNDSDLDDSL